MNTDMDEITPKRKINRLENYDYSSCGAYFVTICTAKRENHFWNVGAVIGRPQDDGNATVGAVIGRPPIIEHPQDVTLSEYGKIVDDAINHISIIYPALSVEHYVIMPDHIHLLLMICPDENGRPMTAPTISWVMNQLKGNVTKRIGHAIWQKSFYDHVIRNKNDYDKHVKYIYENPINWQFDNCNNVNIP
jgi:REP element-mobilizing transposase RayT